MFPVIKVTTVNYPESDGKPMGETDEHRDAMFRHIELLKRYFSGQQVYVSGNLLVYYEAGNPKKFVVPDAFVVKGIDPRKRRSYKLWSEGKAPDVAIETTSRKTKKKDTQVKPEIYARLGLPEYFVFDLTEDYLHPPLQGYRLAGERYQPIEPDAEGGLTSRELGLRLRVESRELQFYRLDTGQRLLTDHEVRQAAEQARGAADQALQAAEAEVARLREELRRLRSQKAD